MNFKILNTIGEVYTKEAQKILNGLGSVSYSVPTQDELSDKIEIYDVIIAGLGLNFTKEVLERAKNLKVIATATTGLDHIDIDDAESKGITILSLRGEEEFLNTITSTGELAFGLLLSLIRYIPYSFDDVKNYIWKRENFRGYSLYGKTIGIAGMGRLGRIVARGADGFRMKVLFCDPNVSKEKHPEYTKVKFDELLERSDFVSIHIHLGKETEGLFSARVFKKMKKSAYLINTSRGEIIDEEALLEALDGGEIAGYGTDVLAGELDFNRNFSNYPLVEYARNHKNCIIVPHIGGMTHDSRTATDVFIAEKVATHFRNM